MILALLINNRELRVSKTQVPYFLMALSYSMGKQSAKLENFYFICSQQSCSRMAIVFVGDLEGEPSILFNIVLLSTFENKIETCGFFLDFYPSSLGGSSDVGCSPVLQISKP